MPVSALKTVSTARNGLGAFILQCLRLDFHYSDWAGSSKGMNAFLTSPTFHTFTKSHPQIAIHLSPRPTHHPIVRARYINGREKVICVRNMEAGQVLRKVELLRDGSGERNRRGGRGGRVVGGGAGGGGGGGGGVRGVWDGFHGIRGGV